MRIFTLLAVCGLALPAYSLPGGNPADENQQQLRVSGKVTDAETGAGMAGVNITVKGTAIGTISDAEGNYSLSVSDRNATMAFSFIGYVTKEIALNGRASLDVALTGEVRGLDEVVVVGYGTQKKASVTGALTFMKSAEVERINVPNLSNALAGRMSGVFVNQVTGAPGYAAKIRVRSVNTWKSTGNDPLYVIDGIITDKRSFDALDFTQVDNITVLKDAASGAVYGARAANGVILVTTKTGSEGKFKLDYSYSYSFDRPSKIPQYVDAKDMVILANASRTYRGLAPMYDAEEVAWFTANDPGRRWYTDAYVNPTLQRHAITASGGTEKVRYFLGASNFDQTAFIKNASYGKYNLRSNVDVNFTKNLSGIFNIAYSQGTKKRFVMQEDLSGFDITETFGNLWGRLLYYLPYTAPKTSDGHYINPGWIGNPLAFIEEGGTNTRVERNVNLLLGLTYKIPVVKGLSVSAKYSPNYEGMTMKHYEKKTTLYNVVKKGTNSMIYTDEITGSIKSSYPNKERMAKIQEATSSYQLNFSVNFARTFGLHNVDAVLVYEQAEGDYDYFYGVREGFPLVYKDQLWATSAERADSYVSGSEAETGRASYIGRIAYNYGEKYFVNFTTRRDGSMLFAPDYRWGTFPSVSVGWVMSKEDFFNVDQIEFLKLRGSWGLAGNDAVGGWKWSETFNTSGTYLFGTTGQPRVTYGGIVNKNLTWEKTSEWNFGLDSRLFNGLLFSAEYFQRKNYDILDSRIVSLPNSFGGSMPPENYGQVNAHGFELELGYNGKSGEVDYMVRGNFGYATNKVIVKDVAQNIRDNDNPLNRPTDYVNMLVCTGMFRTQAEIDALPEGYNIYGKPATLGCLKFEDVSGVTDGVPDGKIDNYDRQVITGKHYNAPYTYGLNLSANWKGLGAEVFVQGVTGVSKLYDDGYGRRFFDGNRPPTFWLDSWSPENTDAEYPRPVTWDYTWDHYASTFWLKNGNYLRLQYVNLTYALPQSLCQKIKIANLSFILSGTNLLTLSNFKYHDPSGGSMNTYPTMKSYTMGVNISF